MPRLINVRSITKVYGRHTVLQDIDLDVESGESVAIVGESGAGKTTLMRVLLGLAQPTSGQYLFDGMDIFALSSSELKKLVCPLKSGPP